MTGAASRLVVGALTVGLLAVGCRRSSPDDLPTPVDLRLSDRLDGPAEAGYGAALAFDAAGVLLVGAPWGDGGGLFRDEERVLAAEPGDWLGAAIVGGQQVRVAAPGRGAGQILDLEGRVVEEGAPGDRLGSRLVATRRGVASITRGGVSGPDGWRSDARLWSLTVVRQGRRETLVAGRAEGGLEIGGRLVQGASALGRGIAACDLSGDGVPELILGDPLTGRVAIHAGGDLDALNLVAPIVAHDLGPGAASAFACAGRSLFVGAPDRVGGGGVAWLRQPLQERAAPVWLDGMPERQNLGHAVAYDGARLAIGDPGQGRVWIFTARHER